ncbi:MAG: type II toxin-antitoxin system VapC family toxin [Actinomycetota bacterium]|nr:type II toxin-antitoxin system VapC family toxin [Actinomycetota bacterium]
MIFVDSNVPMYMVGATHPRKLQALAALEALTIGRERLATSAEVFQEILRRYSVAGRYDRLQEAFDALEQVVDIVFPVTKHDVQEAKDIAVSRRGFSARDAVHAAVMKRHGITEILTFDRGFDQLPWVERLPRD